MPVQSPCKRLLVDFSERRAADTACPAYLSLSQKKAIFWKKTTLRTQQLGCYSTDQWRPPWFLSFRCPRHALAYVHSAVKKHSRKCLLCNTALLYLSTWCQFFSSRFLRICFDRTSKQPKEKKKPGWLLFQAALCFFFPFWLRFAQTGSALLTATDCPKLKTLRSKSWRAT